MTQLPPHMIRVVKEKEELDERLTKLNLFIRTTSQFKSLYPREKLLLRRQAEVMDEYLRILEERINSYGADES